jgi:hypothetical protein
MSACFGKDSDSDASSSDISLPPTDPSRTVEALLRKNMFSRADFQATPQSKCQNIFERSLKQSTKKSSSVVLLSGDSEPEYPDETPPRLGRQEKRKLFETIGDPLGKAKRPAQRGMPEKDSFRRNSCGAGGGSQTFMTPISKSLEGAPLDPVLRSSAPERSTRAAETPDGLRNSERWISWSQDMDHSVEPNVNNPYSSQPHISDSEKEEEKTPEQISNFKEQLSRRQCKSGEYGEGLGKRLTKTILGRQSRSEYSDHSKKSDESWERHGSIPHDFDEEVETRNPRGQARRSGSFEHRSQDKVRENSQNQGSAEIPGKGKRLPNEKFVKVKLEKEDIQQTKRKSCCGKNCLRILGSTGIRTAREKYFRLKPQDRSLSLQWLVENGSGEIEVDGPLDTQHSLVEPYSRKAYKILDKVCCRAAFKLVFCVGNQILSRLDRLQNKDIMVQKQVGRPVRGVTLILVQWMKDFFEFHCEKLPQKDVIHLPDSYSKLEVWQTFKTSFSNFDKGANVTYRFWCKTWKKHFSHVKIPHVNRFGVCADCEEFKTIRDKAIIAEEKSKSCKRTFGKIVGF